MLTDLEAFLACVFCFGLGLVVAQFIQIRVGLRRRFHEMQEK